MSVKKIELNNILLYFELEGEKSQNHLIRDSCWTTWILTENQGIILSELYEYMFDSIKMNKIIIDLPYYQDRGRRPYAWLWWYARMTDSANHWLGTIVDIIAHFFNITTLVRCVLFESNGFL